jgi:diguanylate cyclase (GGDEF)-like protein
VLIDLDYFKEVNDHFGHPVGDKVLAEFSRAFREKIRDIDIFGRLGGEEFALLMPETDIESAYQAAERLRETVSAIPIEVEGHSISITFSLGVAELRGNMDTLGMLFRRADKALYKAKHSGRNRVVLWEEGLDTKVTS